jgi:hypothetical protein
MTEALRKLAEKRAREEAERAQISDDVRRAVYCFIDAQKQYMTEEEFTLWQKVHKRLEVLAGHYEAQGHEIWKH